MRHRTSYTQLSPRQPLTPAPYAIYAGTAGALAGFPLSTTTPSNGQVLQLIGGQWSPSNVSGGGVSSVTASAPLTSTGGANPNISFNGVLSIANGGTGSASQSFVDLSSGQTIAGAKTFSSLIGGSISGNAATATTATSFSGALSGDVTGGQSTTKVVKLQGVAISTTAPANGQVLQLNGGQWSPASVAEGVSSVTASPPLTSTGGANPNISFNGVLPIANGGTGSASQSFVDLSNPQSVGGAKTFTSAPSFTSPGAPFTVTSTSLVANLNADLLDGLSHCQTIT